MVALHSQPRKNVVTCGDTFQSLIDATYPGISHIVPSERAQDNWFSEHTILCAQNDDVDHINETILKSFLGELKSYCNIDKIINILEAHYSSGYLNSINASGLPLSELNLNVGCPIVILCNLDPANELCVVGGRMWQWGVG